MTKTLHYLLLVIVIIAGCARPYHRMNVETIPFKDYRDDAKIKYAVRQGVLYNFKNYFFAKRELKKEFNLMAFTIVNKSEQIINIKDLQFTCGASVPITPVPIQDLYNSIKQKAGLYWLYSVGTVVYPKPAPGKPNGGFIKNEKLMIPLPFGIVFGAANFGIAYRANKKMKNDFELYDIANRILQPGDSIKGLLTFKGVANCGDIFISVKE